MPSQSIEMHCHPCEFLCETSDKLYYCIHPKHSKTALSEFFSMSKRIIYLGTEDIQPDWCPLKNENNNKL